MNILLSSTNGWNPGDDWIRYGCQNILRETLGTKDVNYLLYNRNVDLMENRRGYSNIDRSIKGNYANSIPYPLIDVFISCGSPEWHGPPMKNFHEAVLNSDAPYILMGQGSVGNNVPFTDLDVQVMMRPNTYIFTRSIEAANLTNSALGVEKAVALPCPAICAMLGTTVKRRLTAQVPQVSLQSPQAVHHSYLTGLSKDIPVIAERFEEWEFYSFNGYKVSANYSASALLAEIGRYEKILTTRLHAAVVALGMGSEVVLVGKGDHRIETAAKMFDIPVVANFDEARRTPGAKDDGGVIKFKTLHDYKQNLKEILKNV